MTYGGRGLWRWWSGSERIGTPAAKAIVESSAKGDPQCEQTEDAAATLARWDVGAQ